MYDSKYNAQFQRCQYYKCLVQSSASSTSVYHRITRRVCYYRFLAFSPERNDSVVYGEVQEFALLISSQVMLLLVDAASLEIVLWVISISSIRVLNAKFQIIMSSLCLNYLCTYDTYSKTINGSTSIFHHMIKLSLHSYMATKYQNVFWL